MAVIKVSKNLLITAFLLCATPAFAQTAEEQELARQALFQAGMEDIVNELNSGSADRFIASIDQADFVDRIFGLRLIDQRVKRQFRENLEFSFDGMIQSAFPGGMEGLRATLLGVQSRGSRGRAVVRFDLPDFQFGYHEYDLLLDEKDRLFIVDWVDFLRGERFTDGIGMSLIQAAPSKPAIRKLIDFPDVRESDLFQFTELLKAARDRQAQRYVEIINGLDERLRRQRVVVLTSVQLMKQIRNRRMTRTALMQMADYYPEEPLYTLMLLDYYFPARKYEEALQSLFALYDRLDVDDAAMEARLSAATLVNGNAGDANAHANKALQLEAGLELAWWSALRARTALEDFSGAVEALQQLETRFGHELGTEALQRDQGLAGLLRSTEFNDWLATRQ
ncbi:hypothetical protein GWP57_14610 [Gammaproteobacteria bacterium]|jgi:hypothetical protein|nr:hypothetical protein [Gammaproteobacteria bacterium]